MFPPVPCPRLGSPPGAYVPPASGQPGDGCGCGCGCPGIVLASSHALPVPGPARPGPAAGSDVVSIEPLVADEATACPPFDFPKVSPLLRGQPHRQVHAGRLRVQQPWLRTPNASLTCSEAARHCQPPSTQPNHSLPAASNSMRAQAPPSTPAGPPFMLLCRYVWGACSVRPTNAHNAVAKFDTQQGTVQVRSGRSGTASCSRRLPCHNWGPAIALLCTVGSLRCQWRSQTKLFPATRLQMWHEPGTLVGEPAFVPAPDATAGEAGWVCSSTKPAARAPPTRRSRLAPNAASPCLCNPARLAEDDGVVLTVLVQASGRGWGRGMGWRGRH